MHLGIIGSLQITKMTKEAKLRNRVLALLLCLPLTLPAQTNHSSLTVQNNSLPYDSTQLYPFGSLVTSNGNFYLSIAATGNQGKLITNTSYWIQISSSGQSSGGATTSLDFGSITGPVSNNTNLQTALNAKAANNAAFQINTVNCALGTNCTVTAAATPTQAGTGAYGNYTLNGNNTDGGRLGLLGASDNSDPTLYLDVFASATGNTLTRLYNTSGVPNIYKVFIGNAPSSCSGFPGTAVVLSLGDGKFTFCATQTSTPLTTTIGTNGGGGGTGPAGAGFYSTNGTPANTLGNNGDTAFDYNSGEIYQKTSGAWTDTNTSIKGNPAYPSAFIYGGPTTGSNTCTVFQTGTNGTIPNADGALADCSGTLSWLDSSVSPAVFRPVLFAQNVSLSLTYTGIPDGACQAQTATVAGLTVGQPLYVGSSLPTGIKVSAKVLTAGSVSQEVCNDSGGTYTPGQISTTLRR